MPGQHLPRRTRAVERKVRARSGGRRGRLRRHLQVAPRSAVVTIRRGLHLRQDTAVKA